MPKTLSILKQYEKEVNNLIESAKDVNLRNRDEIFSVYFHLLSDENEVSNKKNKVTCVLKNFVTLIILLSSLAILLYILLNFHQPTSSLVLRNVQGFIYPSLKFLRILSVPFIKKFPAITGYYDESCLMENPFFYINDMECWPCSNVFTVHQLTGSQNQSIYTSGIPHFTKTNHKSVSLEQLKNLYYKNRNLFNKEPSSIESTLKDKKNLAGVFQFNLNKTSFSDFHVSWRINRMSLARVLRSLFPRPESLDERSGQSVERFIMIDGAKASPYLLPEMECSYISLRVTTGGRTIVLKPSTECGRECRTISIVLNDSSIILWYNWWYWRPVSLPIVNSTELAISYISSYC